MQEKEERKVATQDRKAVQLKRAEREQLKLAQSQPIVSFFQNAKASSKVDIKEESKDVKDDKQQKKTPMKSTLSEIL